LKLVSLYVTLARAGFDRGVLRVRSKNIPALMIVLDVQFL